MGRSLYDKCQNLTILFIDDYLPLQKRMLSILDDYFKSVGVASNGNEGLKKYKDFQKTTGKSYDIVMTDYEMPQLNGLELIKLIKKDNEKQIFIVISAHQNPENLIEFINIEVTYFISKPFGRQNILKILDKVSDKYISLDENILYLNDSLVWYKKEKSLLYKDKQIYLAKYDVLLLEILLKYFNFHCHTDVILSHFYLHSEDIKKSNIRNIVARLRTKIPHVVIKNIYSLGYKLSVS